MPPPVCEAALLRLLSAKENAASNPSLFLNRYREFEQNPPYGDPPVKWLRRASPPSLDVEAPRAAGTQKSCCFASFLIQYRAYLAHFMWVVASHFVGSVEEKLTPQMSYKYLG